MNARGKTGARPPRSSRRLSNANALEEAVKRQREINRLIAVENEKLKAKEAERKSKGRARPNTMHTAKVKIVESEIARLQHNILPSEQAPYVPLIVDELVISAGRHPPASTTRQASAVPAGRRR